MAPMSKGASDKMSDEMSQGGNEWCQHPECHAPRATYCCFCLRPMCSEHIARVSLFTLATCFAPWPAQLTDLLDDLVARRTNTKLWLCEACLLGEFHVRGDAGGMEWEDIAGQALAGVPARSPLDA